MVEPIINVQTKPELATLPLYTPLAGELLHRYCIHLKNAVTV